MPGDLIKESVVDYYFGPYRFDGQRRRLYKDGELVVLTPKAADTLVALMDRAGRVVEKDELLRAVWGEVSVGDDTLAQNISTLRRVLADDPTRPEFIATVPRRGYRFVAAVRTIPSHNTDVVIENPAQAPGTTRGFVAAIVGIAALMTVAGGFLLQRFASHDPPSRRVHFTIPEPESGKFSISGAMMALSPDGQYLSFLVVDESGSNTLWLRPLAATTARRVNGTEGASQPFWSPDSRTVAFFAGRRLMALDVATSAVRVIATLATSRSTGATWSRGGQILFSVPDDAMYLVAAAGGTPERLTPTLDEKCEGCGAWPQFLPDGRHFLYTVISSDRPGVYVGEIGKPGGELLVDAPSSSMYVEPGYVSYARFGTLYLQRLDATRLRTTGTPIPLFDGVAQNVRTGRVLAAMSDTGVMAFRAPPVTELVWMDRTGTPQTVAAPPAVYQNFSIAPDGQRVAAARMDPRTGSTDVWVFDGDREVRVTDDGDWDGDPIWSDDGEYVIYGSRRGNRWRLHRRQATAVGREELLFETDTPVSAVQVLRSTRIIYTLRRTSGPFGLWQLHLGKGTPLARLGEFYYDARLSPDERWLVHGMPVTAGSPGSQALYLSGPPPFGEARRAIAEEATVPRWREDGRELFYLSRDSSIVAVPVDPQGTPSDSPGATLFRTPGPQPTGISGQGYDVTPDGNRFLLKREVGSSSINVVLNWDAGLDDQ